MSLKQIFCQEKAVSILQKAYAADRMPHAYIFAGPDGVGKFTTAKAFSALLLCENPVIEKNSGQPFADSCACCPSCQLLDADSHPDFIHIYKELCQFTKDGKDKTAPVDLPIDVIREFLIEKISARPTHSKKRIFVVSEAEKLNINSQNALLKVLEEPPHFCTIILLCTRLEQLLPTTKSRSQIIRFGPLDEEIIIENLKHTNLDENIVKYFARLSNGSIGLAAKWVQLQLADADIYRMKKEVIKKILKYEYAEALNAAQMMLTEAGKITALCTKIDNNTSKTDINRKAQKTIIRIIISALHDAMKTALKDDKTIINFDQPKDVKKLADLFTPEQLAEKIEFCYEKIRSIDASVNEKLIFEDLLLNLKNFDIIKV